MTTRIPNPARHPIGRVNPTADGFRRYITRRGISLPICNCGGPQYGTDHAPDCEYELRSCELWQDYMDECTS